MYKIDWDKYLSDKRYKPSSKRGSNRNDYRNSFERDYSRVCFITSSRLLYGKTQVIPLTTGDSVHTRITHSIEVMNITDILCANYCRTEEFRQLYGDRAEYYANAIAAVMRAAAFTHDIGNPPFGHFGELVIRDYFRDRFAKIHSEGGSTGMSPEEEYDFIHFDGNLQGFHVLAQANYQGDLAGLNLTYATLGTFCKYPNIGEPRKGQYIGDKKHGIPYPERALFAEVAEACHMRKADGCIRRHPLAFLVEAADSVSYNVMDIEDSFRLHWYSMDTILEYLQQHIVKACPLYPKIQEVAEFRQQHPRSEILDNKCIMELRVAILNYLMELAVRNFVNNLEAIDAGTYSCELLEDDPYNVSVILHQFAVIYIYPNRDIQVALMKGRSVLCGLLDQFIFLADNPEHEYRKCLTPILSAGRIYCAVHHKEHADEPKWWGPESLRNSFDIGQYDAHTRYMLITEQIASLSDQSALDLYQALSGQKL